MLALLISIGLLLPLPTPQAGTTAVQIQVLGTGDQPVAGLTLTLRDAARTVTTQTDATGMATASGLTGAFLRVTDAVLPDGTRLRLDPTTVSEGLRFGLIPSQTRLVMLRRDESLLFLDPEAIFAGTSPDAPTLTPVSLPIAGANASPIHPVDASTSPGVAPGVSILGIIIVSILALPILCAAIWWLLQVRAYRRSRR